METAWIQVFILMLSECVAPEGKTVCQQQELAIEFLDRGECELALEQLVGLKQRADNVIVDENTGRCVASARRHTVYAEAADVRAAQADDADWQPPPADEVAAASATRAAHVQRLENLPECTDENRQWPCRVGDIIIEEPPGKKIDVWRRDQ